MKKSSTSGNRDARCLFNNEEKVPIMADCLQSRKHRKRFTEKKIREALLKCLTVLSGKWCRHQKQGSGQMPVGILLIG